MENEIENVNELEGIGSEERKGEPPKSEGLYLVPEMQRVFKQHKPEYLFQLHADSQPLREIAEAIAKAENVSAYERTGLETILQTWDALCSFIASDSFYGTVFFDFNSASPFLMLEKLRASLESPKNGKQQTGKVSVIKNSFTAAEEAKAILARRSAAG